MYLLLLAVLIDLYGIRADAIPLLAKHLANISTLCCTCGFSSTAAMWLFLNSRIHVLPLGVAQVGYV